jgi:hypothetical protein
MKTVVFFLEEESAKAFLKSFIPRYFPAENEYIFIAFEGKQDLEKQLPRKLRSWRKSNTSFIVLRDQDAGDCLIIKDKLKDICYQADKPETLIRISCRELESWFLGDIATVGTVYNLDNLANLQRKKKYRNPDYLQHPDIELKQLTNNYYQKMAGAREMGLNINIDNNKSHSFNIFISGLRNLI